ncbi:MAG: purine-nucleoside phosphorylase [Actinomycetota bacterium]
MADRRELAGIPGDTFVDEALAVIGRAAPTPQVALVLGSGLSAVAERIEPAAEFAYEDLPGFPPPSVPGHDGRLVLGRLDGAAVVVFCGRVHLYEGHGMAAATFPVRLAAAMGVHTVVVTAAVGGIDPAIAPGTLTVLSDHLNLMGENPLAGWRNPDGSPPFVELAGAYDPALAAEAIERGGDVGLRMTRGVYAALAGPSFETPAEIAFLRAAGASVVGMSVVPEVVPARALGLRVLAIGVVANAAGVPVAHADVLRAVQESAGGLGRLLEELAARLAAPPA